MTNANSIENHVRFLVAEHPCQIVHVQDFDLAVELRCPVLPHSPYAAVIGDGNFATVMRQDGSITQTTHADAFGGGAS